MTDGALAVWCGLWLDPAAGALCYAALRRDVMANLLTRDDRTLREMNETDAAIEDRLVEAIVDAEQDGQITVTEYLRIRTLAYLSLQQTQAINQGWCNRAAGKPVTPVEVSAEAVLA